MPESPQQSQDAPFREGAREAATMQPHRWTAITLGALSIYYCIVCSGCDHSGNPRGACCPEVTGGRSENHDPQRELFADGDSV